MTPTTDSAVSPVRELVKQPSTFTCDNSESGPLYYFAPTERAQGPYLTQRHVEAIIDIDASGNLAGVELIDNMPPPPLSRRSLDTADGVAETKPGSCASCNGTGDLGGNPSYGMCPDCDGTGKFPAPIASRSRNTEVVVKALEWRVPTDHPSDPDRDENVYCADGVGGKYAISKKQKVGPERLLWMADDPFIWVGYNSIPEAKAAAQADFDQRIRSALASPPSPAEVTVDAAMIERAQEAYRMAGEKRHWHPTWPDADAMLEILTAALAQPSKEG